MNKRFYIISFLAILIITGFLFLKPEAQAVTSGGVTSPVSGAAIITNMGYPIYFLGSNGGTSGNILYNVQYNPVNGFSGYGWSPQYGWIQFSGTTATALSLVGGYLNQNDNEVPEWANGLIKLNGSTGGTSGNISYSVTFDATTGNAINHWAWGGNVIGWIDFSGVKLLLPTVVNEGCAGAHYYCVPVEGFPLTVGDNRTSSTSEDGITTYYSWTCPINGGTSESCQESEDNIPITPTTTCLDNPTYPLCCTVVPPTTPDDKALCRKQPHYIEN